MGIFRKEKPASMGNLRSEGIPGNPTCGRPSIRSRDDFVTRRVHVPKYIGTTLRPNIYDLRVHGPFG